MRLTFSGSPIRMCCLFLIMAALVCLVFNAGCGSEGKGNDTGEVPSYESITGSGGSGNSGGSSGSGDSGSSGGGDGGGGSSNPNGTTDTLVLRTINEALNSNGVVMFYGEMENTGGQIAYGIELIMRFFDEDFTEIAYNGCGPMSDRVLQTASHGHCYYAVVPGDTCVFVVNSRVPPEQLSQYTIEVAHKVGNMSDDLINPDLKVTAGSTKEVSANRTVTKSYGENERRAYPAADSHEVFDDEWPRYGVDVEFEQEGEGIAYSFTPVVVFSYEGNMIDFDNGPVDDRFVSIVNYDKYYRKMDYHLFIWWEVNNYSGKSIPSVPDFGEEEIQDLKTVTYTKYVDQNQWFVKNKYGFDEPFELLRETVVTVGE